MWVTSLQWFNNEPCCCFRIFLFQCANGAGSSRLAWIGSRDLIDYSVQPVNNGVWYRCLVHYCGHDHQLMVAKLAHSTASVCLALTLKHWALVAGWYLYLYLITKQCSSWLGIGCIRGSVWRHKNKPDLKRHVVHSTELAVFKIEYRT